MSSMASDSSLSRRRQAVEADRPAAELVDDRQHQPAIALRRARARRPRAAPAPRARRPRVMWPSARTCGVVADPPQQPVGDARRAARRGPPVSRAASSSIGTPRMRAERRTISSMSAARVEIQPVHDAEARAQRRGEQSRARRRADQRELLDRHLHRSRARALADDDVELEVLHRRIEDLLDRRRHAVDLVDEQHFARLQVREDAGEIAGLLDDRARPSCGSARRARWRSRRRASSCRGPAGRRAARDRAPRRALPPRQSTPAGSRARDPGRCSRRGACGRRPASSCASSSTRAAETSRESLMLSGS